MRWFWFDFETFAIKPGLQAPPPVVLAYAWDNAPGVLAHANPKYGAQFAEVLEDAWHSDDTILVAHNTVFETLVTLAWRPSWVDAIFAKLEKGQIRCTQNREKLIRVGRGNHDPECGLDDCMEAWRLPHIPDKKNPWRTRFGKLWDVPLETWASLENRPDLYSLGDLCVRDLYRAQEKAGPQYFADCAAQQRAHTTLALTSAWGFPTDRNAARVVEKETLEQLNGYKAKLIEAGLLRSERKKGETVYVATKAKAEERMLQVCAEQGRRVPRSMITPKELVKVAARHGFEVEVTSKKVQGKDLLELIEAGIPEKELQGNIKLDEEACLVTGDELLLAWTAYGQSRTLLNKIRRLQKTPIQTFYNPIVNTGRTSCSQGDDPKDGEPFISYGMQVQNLPRAGEEVVDDDGKKQNKWGVRECFVAPGYEAWLEKHGHLDPVTGHWQVDLQKYIDSPPPWAIVSVDFDAFEMRTWSQCCKWFLGYSDLMAILNDVRRCPHVEMGTRLENQYVEHDDWQVAYQWGYGLKKADAKKYKAVRGVAKGPNFGLPGGMGALRLMDYCRLGYGVVLTEEQAENACRVWREIYREAQPYLDEIKKIIGPKFGSRGVIKQFVSNRLRGDVGFTDGSNGFFQGLAADAAKAAGWALIREAYLARASAFYGCRPLAFVHDEWLFAVPRARLHEAGYRMAEVQVGAAQKYTPDVLLTASPGASYRWSKAAGDPVKDKSGQLIPYEERVLYA